MASENEITLELRSSKEAPPAQCAPQPSDYVSKDGGEYVVDSSANSHNPIGSRLGSLIRRFEQQLVEYNLEARGIERVGEDERIKRLSWVSYLQAFLLWVSINLAANNITLGMLGPKVYGLSFRDSALCSVFGAFVGALVASWIATWGPVSGIRTMVGISFLLVD